MLIETFIDIFNCNRAVSQVTTFLCKYNLKTYKSRVSISEVFDSDCEPVQC